MSYNFKTMPEQFNTTWEGVVEGAGPQVARPIAQRAEERGSLKSVVERILNPAIQDTAPLLSSKKQKLPVYLTQLLKRAQKENMTAMPSSNHPASSRSISPSKREKSPLSEIYTVYNVGLVRASKSPFSPRLLRTPPPLELDMPLLPNTSSLLPNTSSLPVV